MFASNQTAIAVPLKIWKDPQSNPLLIFSEHLCLIYVGCWSEAGTPADYICKLKFNAGWAARCYGIEFMPYLIKEHHRSSIYEVQNSSWITQATEERLRYYPRWKNWDTRIYHHYAINGHDKYVEVIAESFDEELIPHGKAEDILPLLYQDYDL